MFDIRPLEEEWKQYRKKKLRPWYIGSFLLIILSFLSFFILNSSQMNSNELISYWKSWKKSISFEESKSQNIPQTKSNIVLNGPLLNLEVENETIDQPEADEDTSDESSDNILVDIPILDGSQDEPSNISGNIRKKIHLDIIKTTNVTAYKDVERRFRQSHDIDDSLFLARSYYKKGDYTKAEYWALETNKVDPNIEESILLFVKSKMKLGRKNEAKNILTTYIKKSNSQEARKLLYSIENGKF